VHYYIRVLTKHQLSISSFTLLNSLLDYLIKYYNWFS